jgi:hypothetical protein
MRVTGFVKQNLFNRDERDKQDEKQVHVPVFDESRLSCASL